MLLLQLVPYSHRSRMNRVSYRGGSLPAAEVKETRTGPARRPRLRRDIRICEECPMEDPYRVYDGKRFLRHLGNVCIPWRRAATRLHHHRLKLLRCRKKLRRIIVGHSTDGDFSALAAMTEELRTRTYFGDVS